MINFPTTLDGLYINGQWSAGREHLRVINPATEALLTCKVADRLGSATADMKMLMQSIKKPSRKIDATL